MDDVGKRRRANRQSCAESERDAGLEVARKWAKEDDKYRALLRIAKAVEEGQKGNRRANPATSDRSPTQNGCGRLGQILGRSGLQRRFRTERCQRQSLRRPCSRALPERQNPTVIANVPWDEAPPGRALGRVDATRSGRLDQLAQWLADPPAPVLIRGHAAPIKQPPCLQSRS